MLLRLTDIRQTYLGPTGPIEVLSGASLEMSAGDFVAVQGLSGAGKSTLLWIAGALMRPDSGHVDVRGQDPYALNAEARARFRAVEIGFVFQQFHLIPYLSVLDNVLAPALAAPLPQAAEARSRAEALIARFGLTPRQHHVPSELSTGERQRVALARALFNNPKLILADEPTGNLDSESATVVLDHLTAFAAQGGAVLLVTHDARAGARAQRILRLSSGRLNAEAAPAQEAAHVG